MKSLISICIPTYQRPQLLKEAIESCLAQEYRPIEIIVGDDSKDDISANLVKELSEKLRLNTVIKLRYMHNEPSLGQAKNVNKLFDSAEGDRLILLHDDDLLLPNALVDLDKCWHIEPGITAAFGKQYIISMTGEILDKESKELNKFYYRVSQKEGVQKSAMESALLQQFPNNGYLVLSSAARTTRYDEFEIGANRCCDLEFGIRLANKLEKLYFLNKYICKYRLTDTSINREAKPDLYIYPLIESLEVEKSINWAKEKLLSRLSVGSVHDHAVSGRRMQALKIFLSKNYPLNIRLSLYGFYQLLLIFFPKLERVYGKLLK